MDIDEFLDSVQDDSSSKTSLQEAPFESNQKNTEEKHTVQPRFESSSLSSWDSQIQELSTHIYSQLSQKKYAHALDSFVELKGLISKIVESNMKLHTTLHEALEKSQEELEATLAVMDHESNQILRYIEQLLHLAKAEIDVGHLDVATELYKKINVFYNEIPIEFADKRSAVQDEIIKMYLYMKSKRDVLIKHKFESVVLEFEQLYPFAIQALQQEDLQQSSQMIQRLDSLQKELPSGYPLLRTNLVSKAATMKNQLSYLQHVSQLYGHAKLNPGDVIVSASENQDFIEFEKNTKPFQAISIDPAPTKNSPLHSTYIDSAHSRISTAGNTKGFMESLQQKDLSELDKIAQLEASYDKPVPFQAGHLQKLIEKAESLKTRIHQMKQAISEQEKDE